MVACGSRHHATYPGKVLVLRPILEVALAVLMLLALWIAVPEGVLAQHLARDPSAEPLLQEASVVHRRVTMLARRVQRDLRDSRRFRAAQRATCLNNVLSGLHSTQRGIEAWTSEVKRAEPVTSRLRGMLVIFRRHLKEHRAAAVTCIGGEEPRGTTVEVTIDGPQPDEDPSVVRRPEVIDVPWFAPAR